MVVTPIMDEWFELKGRCDSTDTDMPFHWSWEDKEIAYIHLPLEKYRIDTTSTLFFTIKENYQCGVSRRIFINISDIKKGMNEPRFRRDLPPNMTEKPLIREIIPVETYLAALADFGIF